MTAGAAAARLLALEGRVALVTGASGGIGAAVVELLSAAGARVIGVDRVAAAEGPAEQSLVCDVADPDAVGAMFERLGQRWDRLDVLVHCAGIARDAVLWKLGYDAWTEVMRTNVDSAFLLLARAVPMMRAGSGGAIVVVSSINAERGKFGQSNYAASKAALIGLARSAARETGRFGIRVNVVSPGWIETAMTSSLPEQARAEALRETVLGRTGRPADVAAAVLFLASPMSGHVTGQLLRVDGGQLMA